MQSMRAQDVALLCAEPDGPQLQIGALCFFEAAPLRDRRGRLRTAALRADIAPRLDALPRFRQRIAPTWANLAAPVWLDDADFELDRHLHDVRLPAPGGAARLRDYLDQILSEPMDITHPLWDIHVIDGFDDDTVAVIVRSHHAMADGLALYAAATLLLSAEPRPPRRGTSRWNAQPDPGWGRRNAIALTERAARQAIIAGHLTRQLLDPRRLVTAIRRAAGAIDSIRAGCNAIAPPLALTASVGRRRAFAWASLPMADLTSVKRFCGTTVNDVVLAIVAGALRRELDETETFDPEAPEPRALIPVGTTERNDTDQNNRFTIMSVALPVTVDDPLERVALAHRRVHQHPASTSSGESMLHHLFTIADLVPIPVLRILAPWALRRQRFANLAVSNIPGSPVPLYLCESRLLSVHPFITGVGNIALIVGVLSYTDHLGVGVTVDPDVVGDPDRFIEHLHAAGAELAALAR